MEKIAFLFPGQGSQKLGMLSELAAQFPVVKSTFEEAKQALGYDLWELIQQDETKLNQTEYTQPAVLAASIAIWRIWQENTEIKPDLMAGHSLGEYSALVCAESIGFADALRLVRLRGQLMQTAVPSGQGAMAAVLGLDDQGVIEACKQAAQDEVVSAVNFNAPGQVVIAGKRNAVTRAIETAKALGAKKALLLPVSVPSHCELMRPAAENLAQALEQVSIQTPKIPVVQNVDANIHLSSEEIRSALVKQLFSPVQWVKSVQKLHQESCRTFIECGPGKVLSGLNKRIVSEGSFIAIDDLSGLEAALQLVKN
ncbi:MAG: malonyl CoA-acyl carrier protein transacylase [Gammaproteobacteria bacterium]|jgi:[acyl-carrier-protein] S-malonyltransferase|nr:malonyl CoA-acyl carrier protein transacylase [Gammaproteobacteria bacterium]